MARFAQPLAVFVVVVVDPRPSSSLTSTRVFLPSRAGLFLIGMRPLALAGALELLIISAVDRTTFGLRSLIRALMRCRTTCSMSRPASSSEPITIFWLYNGCGRFSVLLGNFSLAFARFVVVVLEVVVVVVVVVVMVVVDVWVALACVSFSSTAKRKKRGKQINRGSKKSQRSGGDRKKGGCANERRRCTSSICLEI